MELYIGLISGTSVNSVDAVLADFNTHPPQLLSTYEQPFPTELRCQVQALFMPGANELDRLAQLDCALARLFAQAVHALLAKAGYPSEQIKAVGSHGQTVRHAPDADEAYTVQLGNPSLLTELTDITTVADFRRRDMAAGGQGAPLAPAFHQAFFPAGDTVVVNIGGIANITVLSADATVPIMGSDTGPGNALMDVWIERHLDQLFDQDGAWAAGGQVIPELLAKCLADDYFKQAVPKSTGREYFNLTWLERCLASCRQSLHPQDVQATLLMLTATSIAEAIRSQATSAQRVLVCGGGVHNKGLMVALAQQLSPLTVTSTAAYSVDPDFVEALGFAWLAHQALAAKPGNVPTVTGAKGSRVLGGIYPA